MNKVEYKKTSHEIRISAYNRARRKKCSTRTEIHNLLCWFDGFDKDIYGHYHYTYTCIGDYDNGLVWEKA